MKYLLLLLSISAYGQTGQVCVRPDKEAPGKEICIDLPADVKSSLAAFTTTQKNQDETPKYDGIAHLIFSNLQDGLFAAVLDSNPPQKISEAKAAEATARAATDAERAKLRPVVKVEDPK